MWCLARAIGVEMSFTSVMVIAAFVNVVSILPLSINGIGLVNGAFIFLAGVYGMDHEPAVIFVLLQRALVLLVSVFGLVFHLRERRRGGALPANAAVPEMALRQEAGGA